MRAPFSQDMLPAAVKVPAGHTVAMETAAAGDITYQCRAKKDMAGQFEWCLWGRDAGLKDRSGKVVGCYYGPARHLGEHRRLQRSPPRRWPWRRMATPIFRCSW